jgi:hypothetical protein
MLLKSDVQNIVDTFWPWYYSGPKSMGTADAPPVLEGHSEKVQYQTGVVARQEGNLDRSF